MKLKMCVAISICNFVLAGYTFANDLSSTKEDIYTANQDTKVLSVTWSGGSKTIAGVVGGQGQTVRALIDFNGRKAIRYENLASSSAFEAYFTLKRHDNNIFIDCIYTNVRNEQNGILINKAVCGLDKPLVEDYEDLVSDYTDAWKDATAKVDIRSLLKSPPVAVDVVEADFNGVELLRNYKVSDNLSSSLPETLIRKGSKKYSFGVGLFFSVYRADSLTTAAYLDVSTGDHSGPFDRYDASSLGKLL